MIEIDDDDYDALEDLITRHAPNLHGCAAAELRRAIVTDWLPTVVGKELAHHERGRPAPARRSAAGGR